MGWLKALPLITRLVYRLSKVTNTAWWIYVLGILSLFLGALLLNYIFNKINDARLKNRFIRLGNKSPANQSTQVQNDTAPKPLGANVTETANYNKGISLVFNKEENLLEDKRKKPDVAKNNGNIESGEINLSDDLAINSVQSAEDLNESAFLGTIYKDLFEKRATIGKSKSLSDADRDSILSEIVNRMVWKMNESKSTPSIKKLIDIQNEKELRDWALDLVKKRDETSASTSDFC